MMLFLRHQNQKATKEPSYYYFHGSYRICPIIPVLILSVVFYNDILNIFCSFFFLKCDIVTGASILNSCNVYKCRGTCCSYECSPEVVSLEYKGHMLAATEQLLALQTAHLKRMQSYIQV